MKIALAQINPTVGDFHGNSRKILSLYEKAAHKGADLVVFPELAVCGYPPRDLLLNRGFVRENRSALDWLAAKVGETGLVVGYVGPNEAGIGRDCTNRVALLQHGQIQVHRAKTLLPTYDVFEEDRYFEPAMDNQPVPFADRVLGLTICEDIWNDEDFWESKRYAKDPPIELARAGANVIINVSASPWHLGKDGVRREMLTNVAKKTGCPVVYCNLVGGNDELLFDGNSAVIDGSGRLIGTGCAFQDDFFITDLDQPSPVAIRSVSQEESLYEGLVVGLRDYLVKCGFESAVVGLSGGIDSSVTAVLAVRALGANNVRGVALPSQYSSEGSLKDAERLASNLGIRYDVVSIASPFDSVLKELEPLFRGYPVDATEENIQARLRGVILMACSNKFRSLLLTTGNKSELAVGYCTLYGDMSGGLAVISDVPKTRVYRLAEWLNREGEVIPKSCLTKPPSAELKPDQKDQDTLPPYDILDQILEAYVVQEKSAEEIIAEGFDRSTVHRILRLVDANEYKRRQAPPGLKVTSKAFGVGRRFPVAQRYQPMQRQSDQ